MSFRLNCRLKDLMRLAGGEWLCSIITRDDPRKMFDELHEADIIIDIKKLSKGRSLDANAYCWVIIDKISEVTGISKSEVYRKAIREIGGVSAIVCVRDEELERAVRYWESKGLGWQAEPFPSKVQGCTNLVLYCGSSEYDTRQMSQLIDSLIQEAESLGIPTITDEMAEKMLSKWGERKMKKEVVSGDAESTAG